MYILRSCGINGIATLLALSERQLDQSIAAHQEQIQPSPLMNDLEEIYQKLY